MTLERATMPQGPITPQTHIVRHIVTDEDGGPLLAFEQDGFHTYLAYYYDSSAGFRQAIYAPCPPSLISAIDSGLEPVIEGFRWGRYYDVKWEWGIPSSEERRLLSKTLVDTDTAISKLPDDLTVTLVGKQDEELYWELIVKSSYRDVPHSQLSTIDAGFHSLVKTCAPLLADNPSDLEFVVSDYHVDGNFALRLATDIGPLLLRGLPRAELEHATRYPCSILDSILELGGDRAGEMDTTVWDALTNIPTATVYRTGSMLRVFADRQERFGVTAYTRAIQSARVSAPYTQSRVSSDRLSELLRERTQTELSVTGVLVGVDISDTWFHIVTETLEDLKGDIKTPELATQLAGFIGHPVEIRVASSRPKHIPEAKPKSMLLSFDALH